MNRYLTLIVLFIGVNTISAQTIYEEFESYKLDDRREIKIQLPRNYKDNLEKSYPLFIVLDGDYLFEVVAGNVDYYSYWEDMPEAIVVGINQVKSRDADCYYSEQNSLPIESGARFFEFISMELIPHLIGNYRLTDFRVAVGHGETSNFINYYLLKGDPIFRAYINLSPFFATDMLDYIPEGLQKAEKKTFYYLTTASNDIKAIQEDTKTLNKSIAAIDNKNLLYTFDNFEGPTHYSNPTHAIPKALESIFFVFQPISKKEFKEHILTLETSPVDYLLEKYKMIEDLFGLEKQILVNDFKAIEAAIQKSEKFEYFETLGKIARKEYPDTLLGNFYLARYFEEKGETKKAMKTYRSAYILEEIGGITKDEMLDRADAIKRDFGY
jgi:predicted alpha/beta superfamily hydrolase